MANSSAEISLNAMARATFMLWGCAWGTGQRRKARERNIRHAPWRNGADGAAGANLPRAESPASMHHYRATTNGRPFLLLWRATRRITALLQCVDPPALPDRAPELLRRRRHIHMPDPIGTPESIRGGIDDGRT